MSTVSLAISGAAGRMGRRLIALAAEQPGEFMVSAALDAPNSPAQNQDAGTLAGVAALGVPVTAQMQTTPQVVIDFSVPAATRALLAQCVERKIALVIGTTGLTAEDQKAIDAAATSIAILQATNTGLGINVLLALVEQAARQLGDAVDVEIVEVHHNLKKDAPSGTALSLAEAVGKGRGDGRELVHGRAGHEVPRKKGTIGMHAVRMGDVVGEHTVYFAMGGERMELKHVATNRDTFARGALRAAAFLAGKGPGRYTMRDVLGL
ncbi:MAG TPA: 4-hydroxy-tetrahydrodipicolinate reductase [Phycisphaerae bacterium]|nr:4-hydroxy-tetrahydrodipicolinate reductase [Phycisphaerae bacterium]